MGDRKKKPFATEAELCSAFIAAAKKDCPEWVPYPETSRWDILMSCSKTGAQIGIQAKLKLNAEVVSQSLKAWGEWWQEGPDFRAVLVPYGETQAHIQTICDRLGITVLTQISEDQQKGRNWYSPVGLPRGDGWYRDGWHQWCPEKRHRLPDYIPDVKAGDKAPLTLSHWKISAIKLALIAERRPVTRGDIKALNMSPTRWVDRVSGYLTATPNGYVPSKYMPDFKRMHPTNWEQIAADVDVWGETFGIARQQEPTDA